MKTAYRITLLVTGGALVIAAAYWMTPRTAASNAPGPRTVLSAAGKLEIVRRPDPLGALRHRGQLTEVPAYDANSDRGWQVDLRGRDVSSVNLEDRLADLQHADFDSRTRWPNKLPRGFDPAAILELNKNPGLGLRELHRRGITGRGVGLGIIDQALLTGHAEYRDRLRSYEEIHLYASDAQMHGPAVASVAVGKTVGVAPEADLYYIAETHGTYVGRELSWDLTSIARSIDRFLEINATLPPERKIRVVSISLGWSAKRKGTDEVLNAVARASQANVFVVSCSVEQTHKLSFHGLGRTQTSDPDRAESYGPGSWWARDFWAGNAFNPGRKLLVPMDARTLASPAGDEEYVYYPNGGWSWSVPWIAGLYALACQVQPEITPARFWAEALRTGRTISISQNGRCADFGTIADPMALIAALEAQ